MLLNYRSTTKKYQPPQMGNEFHLSKSPSGGLL